MGINVVCDVDGCLVPPRGHKWDFESLSLLATKIANQEALFTLCSGRPATFMEALARQLNITAPLICENGSLLFDPQTKKGLMHPHVSPDFIKERPQIKSAIEDILIDTDAIIELGKDVMFSINSTDSSVFPMILEQLQDILADAPVQIQFSGRSVEVIPQGVTKAEGLAFWAEVTGTTINNALSIGDADNDLEILKAAGFAAAPANCTPNVREIVEYISPFPMVEGVLEIINHYDIK